MSGIVAIFVRYGTGRGKRWLLFIVEDGDLRPASLRYTS